jgi:hypothetical protein
MQAMAAWAPSASVSTTAGNYSNKPQHWRLLVLGIEQYILRDWTQRSSDLMLDQIVARAVY